MDMHWSIWLFVPAAGFVAAGLISTIHQVIYANLEGVDIEQHGVVGNVLYFNTIPAVLWSLLLCMFGGPYLLFRYAARYWQREMLASQGFALCSIISLVWSFCAGVIVIEMMYLLANLQF